jgi:hypothetical protein
MCYCHSQDQRFGICPLRDRKPFVHNCSIITYQRKHRRSTILLHFQYSNSQNACTDPHKGLKDVMSEDHTLKIIDCILEYDKLSDDILFAYGWGRNAGARGSSSRNVVFSALNLSYGFGPENNAPRNKTLLLILCKGDVPKDRFDTTKQVGVQ